MNDHDWMKGQNKDYRAGYYRGRSAGIKECTLAILVVGFVLLMIV